MKRGGSCLHTPAEQPGCLVSPAAALLGSASSESPTGESRPPERLDDGFEPESIYWVCGTTGREIKKKSVMKKRNSKKNNVFSEQNVK